MQFYFGPNHHGFNTGVHTELGGRFTTYALALGGLVAQCSAENPRPEKPEIIEQLDETLRNASDADREEMMKVIYSHLNPGSRQNH